MPLEGISPDQLQMTDTPRLIWIPVREAVKLRWERNPKQHDLGALAESFRKHGFKQIPHYDSNIGIDDGNGRVECLDWMERQGQPIVRGISQSPDGAWVMPLIVGVDDKSKALAESYAIDANNLVLSGAEFAPWEIAKLWDEQSYLSILQELAGSDTLPVSVDGEALNSLLQSEPEPEPQDVSELVDKAAELQAKWQVRRGDVWQVGKHRVMCGDSTNAGDVEKLMQGEKARLVVTSPPYGVGKDYETGGISEWRTLLYATFSNLKSTPLWFVNLGDKKTGNDGYEAHTFGLIVSDFESIGYRLLGLRIWVKQPAWSQSPYWRQSYKPTDEFEYLGIFASDKPKHIKRLSDDELNEWGYRGIWTITSVSKNDNHSAMFPVEIPSRAIRLLTDRDTIVCDPFLGSGTTLVACEQTGRVGRGMEIEPRYVAVSLERLSGFGLTPQRLA